jgi:hypothetical protein
MTETLKAKLLDLLAEIERAGRDVSDMLERERAKINEEVIVAKAAHAYELRELEETIEEMQEKNAEREAFWQKIDAEVIGFLELDSIQKSSVFEKLSDAWEFIDPSKLDAIEAVLEDKYTAKNGKVWLL